MIAGVAYGSCPRGLVDHAMQIDLDRVVGSTDSDVRDPEVRVTSVALRQ